MLSHPNVAAFYRQASLANFTILASSFELSVQFGRTAYSLHLQSRVLRVIEMASTLRLKSSLVTKLIYPLLFVETLICALSFELSHHVPRQHASGFLGRIR